MKIENFLKIINSITARNFLINTTGNIELENEYFIYKILPLSKEKIGFVFKTPKKEESIIKSFITQFTSKYFEPNPSRYDGRYGGVKWEDKSEKEKEFAYHHHRNNMYSKKALLEQIKENAIKNKTKNIFSKYGFYETNYGIGLYVLFGLNNEVAVKKMKNYLDEKEIPYTNEFSDAKWVFRFVININKDIHRKLLNEFNKIN